MTEVIFSFDTEDFTSERNADAVYSLANMLAEEGVVGHFAIVGLLAEQFTNWGRDDVKAALKKHIIGTHTYGHTLHPTVCELSDVPDYREAYAKVRENEAKGIELIGKHLGNSEIMFAVPPGNGDSYVGMYCYADMGIPFYLGGCIHDADNTLIEYCGQIHIPYQMSLEGLFFGGRYDNGAYLDEMAKHDRVIIYHHPNMSVKKMFWDKLNYDRRNMCEYGKWIQAEDRDPAETAGFWDNIRMFIRRIKADGRFRITDLREIKERADAHRPSPVSRERIAGIAQKLRGRIGPVDNYCAADLFYAAAALLRGDEIFVPGAVKGFLGEPAGVSETITLTAEEIRLAAESIVSGEFIPETLIAGGKSIGPADYLSAALDVLAGKDKVTVAPKPQHVDMSAFPDLANFHLAGTWLHSADLKDEFLSDRLRLQSWTLRYLE